MQPPGGETEKGQEPDHVGDRGGKDRRVGAEPVEQQRDQDTAEGRCQHVDDHGGRDDVAEVKQAVCSSGFRRLPAGLDRTIFRTRALPVANRE